MPITVTCSVCGANYNLKDDLAGRKVKCTGCQSVIAVPTVEDNPFAGFSPGAAAPARPSSSPRSATPVAVPTDNPFATFDNDSKRSDDYVPSAVPASSSSQIPGDIPEEFQRDKFLLRQKFWSIRQRYNVADENNQPIIFVERPVFMMKGCLAIFAGLIAMLVLFGGAAFAGIQLQKAIGKEAGMIVMLVLMIVAFLAGLALIIQLYPKRHITFYGDEKKTDILMRAFQDQKWVFINQLYTLADSEGNLLCRFRKNYLHGIFRKRWYVETHEGELLFVVKEDSILLSLLRRTIGIVTDEIPLLGLALAAVLRTNFIFTRAEDGKVIGEFNRRATLLDRYVLDLSRDREGAIDRRIAVAMGVLLDTGEKR